MQLASVRGGARWAPTLRRRDRQGQHRGVLRARIRPARGRAAHDAGDGHTVMGQEISLPVPISPTGVEAVHLSSFASKPVRQVLAANPPTFLQMYWVGGKDEMAAKMEGLQPRTDTATLAHLGTLLGRSSDSAFATQACRQMDRGHRVQRSFEPSAFPLPCLALARFQCQTGMVG